MKKTTLIKLWFIALVLLSFIYSKISYSKKDINLNLIAYSEHESSGDIKSDFAHIGKIYDIFLKKSKISEFKINSIYGNFSKNKNISNMIKNCYSDSIALFYFYGDFVIKDEKLYFKTFSKDNSNDSLFNLTEFSSPVLNFVFIFNPVNSITIDKSFLNDNTLLLTNRSRDFISNIGYFYDHFYGADITIHKSNSTFSDFFNYFKDVAISKIDATIGNSIFISYKWVPSRVVTNLSSQYVYSIATNAGTHKQQNRNFVIYDVVTDPEIVRERVGVELVYDITKINGYWE